MSRIADMLIEVVDKVLEKINIDEADDKTWANIQDWVMEQANGPFDVEKMADAFISKNVCPECLTITYGHKCSCKGE